MPEPFIVGNGQGKGNVMKVLVIGATGQTGRHAVSQAIVRWSVVE